MLEKDRVSAGIDIACRTALREGSWQTEERQQSSEPILIIGRIGDQERGKINASLKVVREYDGDTGSFVEQGRYINLGNISVQPDCRLSGVGRAMLTELDRQAGLFGAEKITGKIVPDEKDAPGVLEFYRKNGYTVGGQKEGGWVVEKVFKPGVLH